VAGGGEAGGGEAGVVEAGVVDAGVEEAGVVEARVMLVGVVEAGVMLVGVMVGGSVRLVGGKVVVVDGVALNGHVWGQRLGRAADVPVHGAAGGAGGAAGGRRVGVDVGAVGAVVLVRRRRQATPPWAPPLPAWRSTQGMSDRGGL
jgi:hypothetical protein